MKLFCFLVLLALSFQLIQSRKEKVLNCLNETSFSEQETHFNDEWINYDNICDGNLLSFAQSKSVDSNKLELFFKNDKNDEMNEENSKVELSFNYQNFEQITLICFAEDFTKTKRWELKSSFRGDDLEHFSFGTEFSSAHLMEGISVECSVKNEGELLPRIREAKIIIINQNQANDLPPQTKEKNPLLKEKKNSQSQRLNCLNPYMYGGYYITLYTPRNTELTISSCVYEREYSVIQNVEVGMELEFRINNPGDEITVRDIYGNVLATGVDRVRFVSSVSGTITVHWNLPNCGTATNCRLATIKIINDCYFALNTKIKPTKLKECLDKIPLKEEVRTNTIQQFRNMLLIHPFTDLLKSKEGIDIETELQIIQNTSYANDFEFHHAMYLLSIRIPDDNTIYYPPPFYQNIYRVSPFVILPQQSTNSMSVSYLSWEYFNINQTAPTTLDGTIESINGVSPVEYFKNLNDLYSKDDSLRFNIGLVNQINIFPFFKNSHQDIFRESDTYKIVGGSSFNYDVNLFSSSQQDLSVYDPSIQKKSDSQTQIPNQKTEKSPNDLFHLEKKRFNLDNNDLKLGSDLSINKKIKVEDFKSRKNYLREFSNIIMPGDYDNGDNGAKNRNNNNAARYYTLIEVTLSIRRGRVIRDDLVEVPFLKINSFNVDNNNVESFKTIVLNFLKDISERNSTLAIIDVSDNYGGPIQMVEWTVNVLRNTFPKVYQKTTVDSPFFKVGFDQRITSEESKLISFSLFSSGLVIDPTTGKAFSNYECGLENPITMKRAETEEKFSPIQFTSNSLEFLRVPPFKTKFYIVTNGNCVSGCSHFISGMRERNLAKVFGFGGVTGLPMESSFGYGTDLFPWDELIKAVPRFGFSALSGELYFGTTEYYLFSSESKRVENQKRKQNHHQNQRHYEENEHDENQYHHKEYYHNNHQQQEEQDSEHDHEYNHYHENENGEDGNGEEQTKRFYIPNQYSSKKYVDQVIGWDIFSYVPLDPDYSSLYSIVSKMGFEMQRKEQFQSFQVFGECYSKK